MVTQRESRLLHFLRTEMDGGEEVDGEGERGRFELISQQSRVASPEPYVRFGMSCD